MGHVDLIVCTSGIDHAWSLSFYFKMWNWQRLIMVAWPWSTMVQPWSNIARPWSTMVIDHGSATLILRGIDWNAWTSGIRPWLTMVIWFSENVELTMVDHGQTMVAWFNLTMVNHGSTMVKTLSDNGQPWSLTMVQPCSSPRGIDNECLDIRYLTMSDHGQPWLAMVAI